MVTRFKSGAVVTCVKGGAVYGDVFQEWRSGDACQSGAVVTRAKGDAVHGDACQGRRSAW